MAQNGVSEQTVSPGINALTPKQSRFLEALLAGHTILTASKVAKVAEKTAHLWLKQSAVKQAYKEAQQAIFEEAVNSLMCDVYAARNTLRILMTDKDGSASVRLRAAQIILESAIELHKMSGLEQKVDELKRLVEEYGMVRKGRV